MSVSSGSSLYGDQDQDLLFDDEEDIDFYAILNVPKNATEDEINKAYRRRCLIFHPDRHNDEEQKKEAEKIFVQLRRAHETLMDPKQRAIYDALGVQGLDTQGWELVSRSANPENIRREYEFLQRLKEQELMLQRVHPSSGFIVKTSVAGMFQEDPDDRYPPQLIGIAISQSVDCAMTADDRVGLTGRVKSANGRGDGNVTAVWRKSAGQYHVENMLTASSEALNLTCRIARNLYTRAAIIVQPSIQYFPLQEAFAPALTLIYSMRLRVRWQGSIILNLTPIQSAITTTLVHTENNQPKAVANFTLSPSNSNIRLAYYFRNPEQDAFTETAVQISMFGISPSIHFERRLSRFSRIGCALHFSFPSCMMTAKFKLKTGQSSFEWQVVLCDDRDALARSTIYGVVVPVVLFQLATKVIFRKWAERFSSLFDDHSRDREARVHVSCWEGTLHISLLSKSVDTVKQEEAVRVINLMRPTADRIRREEEQKLGIVIVDARYGQSESSGSTSYVVAGDRTIDVTIPLQAMVNDSQLRIFSVKSQLPGFYDPCPGEPKMLHVRYKFRDEPHAVTVADDMPLQIPTKSHRISGR